MLLRELTREEKAAIRSLVTKWCANYDREMGCLPLDCECHMLGKCWTGAYCRYFREAVLPLNPVLEAALNTEGPAPETRPCPICGRPFLPDGRRRYCSEACSKAARQKKQRGYMRKYRG
ncbi:cysteine-rich VLP protein [uncultured Oscillibacter sp.]|uniref:cysteine-rich VLP protein n=1 Tax=uncultured Oscillibacter sp. TaxID=876091 RepID=UPI0025DF0565|nr:cysteine-rich VLP protein [uncultured Oscillibacter sp.]